MARRPPLADERLKAVKRLTEFALDRGHSILEYMSWLVCQPSVGAVIAG
jgi:hypothetical protein